MQMKKVLLVAYHYPPSSAVGAVRPSKFVEYLPAFGWSPNVLTTPMAEPGFPVRVEAGEVHRVQEWPHPLKSYERFKVRSLKRQGREQELARKMSVPYTQWMAPSRSGLVGLKLWVGAWGWLPDRETGWLIPAIRRGLSLIRREPGTCLLTTGPPFTCHLIGLVLKRLTGARWIADFRDPWSLSHKVPLIRNNWTDLIEQRMMRAVMGKADRVISVTQFMTEQARKEYPDLDPDKFVTVSSGFDSSDFTDLPATRPAQPPVVFSYLGTFYYGRSPESFLVAVASLFADGSVKQGDLVVKFIGNVAMADGQPVHEMVQRLGLEETVSIEPLVPRREALKKTLESHIALVLDERHPIQIPFKLYDALAAGAVIFNIGSRGAVSEVLAKTGRGISVDHTNVAEIRDGILECIRRSRSMENRRSSAPWLDPTIQDYNFQRLTGRLAGLLERVGSTG